MIMRDNASLCTADHFSRLRGFGRDSTGPGFKRSREVKILVYIGLAVLEYYVNPSVSSLAEEFDTKNGYTKGPSLGMNC
jgi:hypothetical protein